MRVRTTLAVLSTLALTTAGLTTAGLAGATAAGAADREHRTTVYRLAPSTHGNPEGVAAVPHSETFFVGATGDGTIYRGDLDRRVLRPYIAGAKGRSAIGLKVAGGRLYVAGGATGTISVYRIATGRLVAHFDTGAGGFLNDLVVTDAGDVYVTDSFRPTLWHVTAAQVRAGHGTVAGIGVSPEIAYQGDGAFNLNGIVALRGGRELMVVDSATGRLFRIVPGAPGGRRITRVRAPKLLGGDGMLLDRGRLVVVVGSPASLNFLVLTADHSSARLVHVRTDPTLRGPSTVAAADDRYLVVNADFSTGTTPFTVSGLARD